MFKLYELKGNRQFYCIDIEWNDKLCIKVGAWYVNRAVCVYTPTVMRMHLTHNLRFARFRVQSHINMYLFSTACRGCVSSHLSTDVSVT